MGVLDWVERSGCADAACVTVALETSPRQLLEAMGADLSSLKQATFEEAEAAWSEDATPIQVWAADGRTIAVEPNGYLASLAENLRKVARKGEAVSVFWNVNALMRVLVVRDGELLREFDPLLYDDDGAPLPEEAGLAFGTLEQPRAAALAFLERRTGFVASEEEILGARRATYWIPSRRPLPTNRSVE